MNAFIEPYWTMAMAVTWVATRDRATVERYWPSNPRQQEKSLIIIQAVTLEAAPYTWDASEAFEHVRRALAVGELTSIAEKNQSKNGHIPTEDWLYMRHDGEFDGGLADRWVLNTGDTFRMVRLKSADVLRLWPGQHLSAVPAANISQAPTPAAVNKVTQFQDALRQEVVTSPMEKKRTKAEAALWGKTDYGLGPYQAREAWGFVMKPLENEGISHVWNQRGAPKGPRE